MAQDIKLLDCTLRDGAHLNKGRFGKRVIVDTINDLVETNVDIIEVGFFDNEEHDDDTSFFSSIADVKRILPKNSKNSAFCLMADFVDVSKVEPCDGTVEFFRLSFKRHRLDWGLNAAKILTEKGYKCYINPVNCNVYSDAEYLEVIDKVNKVRPYGFSIVDTFGVLRKPDLSRIYYLLEGNLDPDIRIGVHLHENLGLAYSLAQHFLEIKNPKRKVSVDCSLLGMGRVPGNLCTEQIMDHLNINYGTEYNTEPALDAIDDYIAPIKRKIPWGYSVPYALSGKYGLHRTYAEYLMGKNRLKTKDIQRILRMIDKEHIELFDEKYVESLYRQYISVAFDDINSVENLSERLFGKNVVVICPGSSIITYQEKIIEFISKNNAVVISVNFVPEFIKPDYVFCANKKRLGNLVDNSEIERIVTSNVSEDLDNKEFVISFNECVYFNEVFCEDSTLMLLKTLLRCGEKSIAIAGFDGFIEKHENYFDSNYTHEEGKNINSNTVKKILNTTLSEMSIYYITPSLYEKG